MTPRASRKRISTLRLSNRRPFGKRGARFPPKKSDPKENADLAAGVLVLHCGSAYNPQKQ